ncbi:hypothetical protein GCM10027589_08090 [Actinocorallia lasiicapitis]
MPGPEPLSNDDPRAIGPYRLVSRLGSGGQGTVLLGLLPGGEQVAIKLLHEGFDDERTRLRFLREVDSARRVAGFCTAAVLGTGTHEGRPYIVSEFIPGPSLRDLITGEGPRSASQLERLAVGTITALAAIHQAGIVHRDLKPGNVIIGPDGPRVVDFGIARAMDDVTHTRSGVFGTPAFMSPEQFTSPRVGPASDVFSWATTLYFAATGRLPFDAPTPPMVMNKVINTEPDLRMVPPRFADLLARCFDKIPERRPPATELLLSLLGNRMETIERDWADPAPPDVLRVGAQVAAEDTTGRTLRLFSRRRVLAGGGLVAVGAAGAVAAGIVLKSRGGGGLKDGALLKGHTTGVTALEFADTGDRTLLLSGASDRTVRVWDPITAKAQGAPLRGHTGWVGAVRFFPNEGEPFAVSAGEDRTLRIWNLNSHTEEAVLTGHGSWVGALAIDGVGGVPVVVSTGGDMTVRVWDLVGRKPLGSVMRGHENVVGALAMGSLSDRQVIMSGDANGKIRLWDLETHRPVGEPLEGHIGQVQALAYTVIGGRPTALSVGDDTLLHVWDLVDRRHTAYKGHTDKVHGLVAAEVDGVKAAVTVGNDMTLRVWNLADGTDLRPPRTVSQKIAWVVATGRVEGEDVIATGGHDTYIRLWKG